MKRSQGVRLKDISLFARLKAVLGGRDAKPAAPTPALRVEELAEPDDAAAALFQRTFKQNVPLVPRHFVLVHEPPGGERLTLGYVHQTPFEGVAHLSGGLISDAWQFRKLPLNVQQLIRQRGGMAEMTMRDSLRLCMPCQAFFACIGDAKSLTVNARIGFVAAGGTNKFLYVNPMAGVSKESLGGLIARVDQVGMF